MAKRKPITITKIRKSLLEQLEAKDAKVDCFIDLVDSYIYYTEKEREMQTDIEERGLYFDSVSSTGKEYIKDNPSIKNAIMYNKQRLAILNQLGLSIDNVDGDSDDEL